MDNSSTSLPPQRIEPLESLGPSYRVYSRQLADIDSRNLRNLLDSSERPYGLGASFCNTRLNYLVSAGSALGAKLAPVKPLRKWAKNLRPHLIHFGSPCPPLAPRRVTKGGGGVETLAPENNRGGGGSIPPLLQKLAQPWHKSRLTDALRQPLRWRLLTYFRIVSEQWFECRPDVIE